MEQGMRFAEIGHQLRAYRMESGLRAEEIAARLGVSRAALYRYEKGEVIKLDTVKRMAELLKVSPMSLLGIGVEYYSRSVGFFERVRQIEEASDQILQAFGPFCYLTSSKEYDDLLADALAHSVSIATADRSAMQVTADQVLALLTARKQAYGQRRPGIIALLASAAIRSFLEHGIFASLPLPAELRARSRAVAAAEMNAIAELMEAEPMGLQFSLIANAEPSSGFVILRGRDRATLAVNPFRADSAPAAQTGVAMITGADEAVIAHQRVAEAMWRDSVRGAAAAAAVREMVASYGPGAG